MNNAILHGNGSENKLFIKNMVSVRCKMIVKSELEKLGVPFTSVDLGEVIVSEKLSPQKQDHLSVALKRFGFELLQDHKSRMVEQIKLIISEMVLYAEELPKVNHSSFISQKLNHNYVSLSNLFSEMEGITIEHYIIAYKIERVKELLASDQLTLTEISYKLGYSSVAHLSNQFKKVTGLTPTQFMLLKNKKVNQHKSIPITSRSFLSSLNFTNSSDTAA